MYQSDIQHENTTLQAKLEKLYTMRGGAKIALGFRPSYTQLLEKLGNPHKNLPPVIHVAGTNGKGSTIAFMRAILEAAGYKVHVYTSPHLIQFNERIVLAGKEINDKTLETLIDEALAPEQNTDLTFFEITTAIALAAFARNPADILLLEVGVGGRLDCTNIIENPAACVITPISKDHTEYLGETIADIAAEKAGIIKPNVPCILGPQHPNAQNTLAKKATALKAPLYSHKVNWSIDHTYGSNDPIMNLVVNNNRLTLTPPSMIGRHQIYNAGLAVSALKILENVTDLRVSQFAIETGLAHAHWRGRLQRIQVQGFDKYEIYVDGGHNEDAGHALASQAKAWQSIDNKPLHLILSMMKHKSPQSFLSPLVSYLESIHIVPIINEPHAMNIRALMTHTRNAAPTTQITSAPSWVEACNMISATNKAHNSRILIAGSLYLVGQILQDL